MSSPQLPAEDAASETAADPGLSHGDGDLRSEMAVEIEAMILHLLSDGRALPRSVAGSLDTLETPGALSLTDLAAFHTALARACKTKPRMICALYRGRRTTGIARVLGPMPVVRHLTLASILFAVLFFATSLSGQINWQTVNSSIYDMQGTTLAIKLVLVCSAAGLGASFAVLFDVWNDLSREKFDPMSESANWMRIGLGVVAGLILAEIIGPERGSGGEALSPDSLPTFTDPLLALIGGFSATVLHMIMTSIVDAFRRAFSSASDTVNESTVEAIVGRLAPVLGDAAAPLSPTLSPTPSPQTPKPPAATLIPQNGAD